MQELLLAVSPQRGVSRSAPLLTLEVLALETTTFADFHPSERQCLVCVRQFTGSVLHRCWFTQEMAHAA